jgi:hypothetical protein
MNDFKEIKNFSQYLIDKSGRIKNKSNKILKPHLRKSTTTPNHPGYLRIRLIGDDGYSKTFSVHRLVASTYLDYDLNSELVVDHIDDNPLNNDVSNLQITTRRINTLKGVKRTVNKLAGTYKSGSTYVSRFKIGRKKIYLGRYTTEEEAHQAYLLGVQLKDFYKGDDKEFREMVITKLKLMQKFINQNPFNHEK